MPDTEPTSLHEQALQAYAAGNRAAAAALCRDLLSRDPRHAEAAFLLGVIAIDEGRPAEARAEFERARSLRPGEARFLHAHGEACRSLGRLDEAAESLLAAVRLDPALAAAHNTLGVMAFDAGDIAAAIGRLSAGIAVRPDYPRLHLNLGRARQLGHDVDGAIACYREAIRLDPRYAIAHNNLGAALHSQGRLAEAAVPLRRAIEIQPGYPEAHFNLGNVLAAADDPAAALERYREALRLRPDYFNARLQMGIALESLGQRPEAMAIYESLVQLKPESREAWERLTLLLMVSNQWDRTRHALEQLAARAAPPSPGFPGSPVDPPHTNLVYAKQMLCDWSDREADFESLGLEVDARLATGQPGGVTPFYAIVFAWPAARQLAIARAESRQLAARQAALREEIAAARPTRSPGRLRIGYLSGDFYDHAVSHLTQGMFALHDRAQFEVFAYSFGPDDGSRYRWRIERDCEHFTDVRDLRTRELARRIAADRIDILVEMMGFSGFTRLEALAARPARVQMSWLAYPGTTGADFIDYVVGDRWITPPESAADFSEQLVRLPHCYLPTDREQPVAATAGCRRDHGLPEEAFVFACINNAYKFEPEIFSVWMRILSRVPRSVLWLKSGGATMEANLGRAAEARGVSPERLVFSRTNIPKPDHLARLRLADLFLDTHAYNAHTTAADALWAGLPVLTCPGTTFASRVGASLLEAVELPELIADDLGHYERLAVRLALDPGELARLRSRLADNRGSCPLFDTPRFVCNLERGYRAVWAIYEAGEKPRAVDIAD
jgi:predicted O-linked N-acetylglucosamine transferase (SPINDLY family)